MIHVRVNVVDAGCASVWGLSLTCQFGVTGQIIGNYIFKMSTCIMYNVTMSINFIIVTHDSYTFTSAQRRKLVLNPELWEYNQEEIARFTPLIRCP